MRKKIFRAISAVAIGILLASLLLTFGVLYRYFDRQFQAELANSAAYIAQGVMHEGAGYFEGLQTENGRITWIAADGTVLYDSFADASALENHAARGEVQDALREGAGSSMRFSETNGETTYYYALRLDDGTILRISNTRYSLISLVLSMTAPLIVIFLIAIAICAVIGTRLSRQIVQPINRIDLDHPEQSRVYDELYPLLGKIQLQKHIIAEQIQQMQQQQQEFSAITKNMSEGFLVLDREGRILSYNDSLLLMLNLGAVAFHEKRDVLALPLDDSFRTAVLLALSGEHDERHMEANERHYLIMANPVHSGETISGAVIVVLDHTEKENGDVMRREFTANVSHELKTPLTSISGYAEMIETGIAKPEDVKGFAHKISREAGRLVALIGDILKLSRLDESEIEKNETVNLAQTARECAEDLQIKAENNNVSLEISADDAYVKGDGNLLYELVYNLCDNAIRYNKPGGKVNITVSGKNGTVLKVADTGIGIPPEHQDRIFERFYRVDKSRSKETGGTGLGLAIVKYIAQQHGASVSLKSQEGKGTEITVTFNPAE